MKMWIDDLRKLADPAVVVVVGNKSDLAEKRQVDQAGVCHNCCFIHRIFLHRRSHFHRLNSALDFCAIAACRIDQLTCSTLIDFR